MKVLALVGRTTGHSRAFVIDSVSEQAIDPIVARNLSAEAHMMTDEHKVYKAISRYYAAHSTVAHYAGQYTIPGTVLHTNTIEGYFSIFKRGMRGVYQFCREKHLHRYLAEFDFRYSNRIALGVDDTARADNLLKGVVGKRLKYV